MPSIALPMSLRGQLLSRAYVPSDLFISSEPGFWFDPSDVANLDWRRNLLTYTEQFDNAAWVVTVPATTVTQNQITAPDGTLTADRLIEEAVSGAHYRSQNASIVSGSTYTISMYVKKGVGSSAPDWVQMTHGSAAFGGSQYANFNISTGSVGEVVGGIAQIANAGNGWYRISFTATATSTAIAPGGLVFTNNNNAAGRTPSYSGAVTSDVFVWGAQLELGSVATEYQRITDVNTEVIQRFPTATLFQDSAGTTPVTAAGQSVGLALDKSKGLVLGPELVTNGTFDTNVTGWTANGTSSVTWESGAARWSTATAEFSGLRSSSFTTVVGRTYEIKATVLQNTGASWRIVLVNGDGSYNAGTDAVSSAGSLTVRFVAAQTTSFVEIRNFNAATANRLIDNISVKELPGFHATAAGTKRPTLGRHPASGIRNLLTYTEQFDNAAWLKVNVTVSANSAVAPDGTMTADKLVVGNGAGGSAANGDGIFLARTVPTGTYRYSIYAKAAEFSVLRVRETIAEGSFLLVDLTNGTITNGSPAMFGSPTATLVQDGWYRVSWTTPSNTTNANRYSFRTGPVGDGTSGILIWGAQLETGSTATPYQKVVSAFDVTEVPYRDLWYLGFDGVDDALVTSTITPGTDKVQVFAGVRKLSDAAAAALVEFGASPFTTDGTFSWLAPHAAAATVAFYSRGTVLQGVASATNYASPISMVLSGTGDISGDAIRGRVNGVLVINDTDDQGTGNYLAYPLYIGARGGTSLFFNGRLYGLIGRFGPNLSAGQIANTESWLNYKTGAY